MVNLGKMLPELEFAYQWVPEKLTEEELLNRLVGSY
jgi:hypothetical protein